MDVNRRYFLRLFSFCIGRTMDVLSYFIDTCVLKNGDFDMFLDTFKHQLFHTWEPTIPCCECFKTISLAAQYKKRKIDEKLMRTVYEIDGSLAVHIRSHSGKIVQECLCKVSVIPGKTTDSLDIGLAYCILQTCAPTEFNQIRVQVETIRKIRNELAHPGSKGIMSETEFNSKWEELRSVVLDIARKISVPYERQANKLISELKNSDTNLEDINDKLNSVKEDMKKVSEYTEATRKKFTESLATKQEICEIREEIREDIQEQLKPMKMMLRVLLMRLNTVGNPCRTDTSEIESIMKITGNIDEELLLKNLQQQEQVESDPSFIIKSGKENCIILELNTSPDIFQSTETFRRAVRSLITRIVRAGQIDTNISDTIEFELTFISPLTQDEIDKVSSLATLQEESEHELDSHFSDNTSELTCKEWLQNYSEDLYREKQAIETNIEICNHKLEGLPLASSLDKRQTYSYLTTEKTELKQKMILKKLQIGFHQQFAEDYFKKSEGQKLALVPEKEHIYAETQVERYDSKIDETLEEYVVARYGTIKPDIPDIQESYPLSGPSKSSPKAPKDIIHKEMKTNASKHRSSTTFTVDNQDEQSSNWCQQCKSRTRPVFQCPTCGLICRECNIHHLTDHTTVLSSYDDNFHIDGIAIQDVAALRDGLIVISDGQGRQLITYDVNDRHRQCIPLPSVPGKLAVVDNNNVAVVLSNKKVCIVDVREKRITKRIVLNKICHGIMCRKGHLYVGCGDKSLLKVEMTGDIKYTIPISFKPRCLCSGTDDRIYCIDKFSNTISCIDKDGHTVFNFTNPDMYRPCGITSDNEGHVLVVCRRSNTVYRITSDGKHYDTFIKDIPSRDSASYIFCDSKSKSVIIGRGDTVYVYKT